ncbi:MAG TPA: DoxX family protein [Thermoanaerobaculia bacterium]|nr:DoxX family protein [Thermoanaerobaculia bacterium]
MSETRSTGAKVGTWLLRLIAAGILLQTLFFKLTGAPESVYIFETLGAEPWGRIGSALVELVASILLLIPATTAFGALLAAVVMLGAIGSHLTRLGIEVQGDGGMLFALACVVLLSSLALLWLHRDQLAKLARRR